MPVLMVLAIHHGPGRKGGVRHDLTENTVGLKGCAAKGILINKLSFTFFN